MAASPIKRDESPRLKFLMDQLDHTFYMDEDSAAASVLIESIEQLQIALEYYAGKTVQITLSAEIIDGNYSTLALLSHKANGRTKTNIKEKITLKQGADQIIAICNALTK